MKYFIIAVVLILVIGSITQFDWKSASQEYKEYNEKDSTNSTNTQNYSIQENKIIPLTQLNEEQLKIQKEQGCKACHPNFF